MSNKYELVVFAMAMAQDNDKTLENIVNNNHLPDDPGNHGNQGGNHGGMRNDNDGVERWWEHSLDELMEGVTSYSDLGNGRKR